MLYTTTLHDGQLVIPDSLLSEAGLGANAVVNLRPGQGGLVIEVLAEAVTVAEAETRFPNEWIFMAVTQTDEQGMAQGGRIIAHAPHHDQVAEQAQPWIAAHPGQPNFLFYSGEPQGVVIV